MQYRSAAPFERVVSDPSLAADERIAGPGSASVEPRSWAVVAEPCEVASVAVEYQVRAARVTDIDRGRRRASRHMNIPTVLRDRAGRAYPPVKESS
jgi:hypothetical protein